MERLTLPEPARTLLARTRSILEAYVTPRTPDGSGWSIGGGTILAARWRHRDSQDLDLLVPPGTETRYWQPEAAPELHRHLKALGATEITFGRFSRIRFGASHIDLVAAEPQPRVGHRLAIVDGGETMTLAASQILTGKFANRSLNAPVRDLFDFAVAATEAPRALAMAVNALEGGDIRWRLASWEMERDAFAAKAARDLEGVTPRHQALRADPALYARRAVMDAVYRHVRLHARGGEAVVETENALHGETRTCGPDDLDERFEADGINALLAAAELDPARIRRETAEALRNGGRATILELDEDWEGRLTG